MFSASLIENSIGIVAHDWHNRFGSREKRGKVHVLRSRGRNPKWSVLVCLLAFLVSFRYDFSLAPVMTKTFTMVKKKYEAVLRTFRQNRRLLHHCSSEIIVPPSLVSASVRQNRFPI